MDNITAVQPIKFNELYHHGILGQKWGVRRFQNEDGSYTNAGKKRYGIDDAKKLASSSVKSFMDSYNEKKIDTLDVLNRKGVLDFLDSKADEPFKSITDGVGEAGKYKSSSNDLFRALSNLERYSEVNFANRKQKEGQDIRWDKGRVDTAVVDNFNKDNKALTRFMDSYTNKEQNLSKVSKSLIDRYGQSVYDKRLGMVSKDVRDIEREIRAKDFLSSMKDKSGKWSVSNTGLGWYNLDKYGRQIEDFLGQKSIIEKRKVDVPVYKKITTPDKVVEINSHKWDLNKIHPNLWSYDEQGRAGRYNKNNEFIPADENGIVQEKYKHVIPGSTQTKQVGYRQEVRDVVLGNTKEYSKWIDAHTPKEDYSHLVSVYKDEIKIGSDWIREMAHSCLDGTSFQNTDEFLAHHGVKGQKWGKRQYQNNDGSLTPLGRVHYGIGSAKKGIENFTKKASSITKDGTHKLAESIQKTIKPTDEQLNEKLDTARQKMDTRAKKQAIKEMNSAGKNKRKKLKDMNDQEILDYLNRLRNESEIRKYKRAERQTPVGKFFEDYAKQGLTRGMNRAIENAITNMLEGNKSKTYQDVLREQKAKMELMAIGGDTDAINTMKRMGYIKDKDKDNKKEQNTQSNQSNQNKSKNTKQNNDVLNTFTRTDSSRDTNDYSTPKYTKKEQKENQKTANKYNFKSDDNRSLISNNSLSNDVYKRKKR